MKRLTLLLGMLVLGAPSAAVADGCPLPCSGAQASPKGSQLVFVQPKGEAGPLVVYDTRTRAVRFSLPPGRASADGRSFFTATALRTATSVVRFDAATGKVVAARLVPGRWKLASVSPTGLWLALTAGSTRIAIVAVDGFEIVRRIRLGGRFEVETISADGQRLFLIQHLRAGRYLVRLYDVRRGLRSDPLRDPEAGGVMAGLAWSGVASPDGRWLLTLYLNTRRDSAFVHALDLRRARAACIFLPGTGLARLKSYALTLAPDGRRLYATSPALGVVAEVDLGRSRVVRRTRLISRPATGSVAALAPDGGSLVLAGGRRIWSFDTRSRRVRGPFLLPGRVVGLGWGDGVPFAALAGGEIVATRA